MQVKHGAGDLREVVIDGYNSELRDGESFIGDRANKRVFKAIMDNWRGRLRVAEKDPFDGRPTDDLCKDKKALETILISGDAEAAGVVIVRVAVHIDNSARGSFAGR
jgi:hypothetical protein